MRQIGEPPERDTRLYDLVKGHYERNGLEVIDATYNTGAKDYLERIIGLIRGTGFTTAIFTEDTRQTAFANIALELGFAALFGKPLIIVKSVGAKPPSDLTRTDWIEFEEGNEQGFKEKLGQAINDMSALSGHLNQLFEVSEDAERMDCAHAFELVQKAFLLSGSMDSIDRARLILERVRRAPRLEDIDDLQRLRKEVTLFVKKATEAVAV